MRRLIRSQCVRFFSNSSFEGRASLKEFYKNIHPDILSNAPDQVREQNMRSLKILNDYMDKLRKNQGSEPVAVQFYTPEHSTSKMNKFLFMDLKLEKFENNLDEEYVKELREK